MKKPDVRRMLLCALFAALSAMLSQISIPIGAVPIALTHVSVFLAAGLLGAKYGALSQVVFVGLGLIGLPVFTRFGAGIGVLMGPTGGFLPGYIATALVAGLLIERLGTSVRALMLSMYAGWVVTYLFGIPWFMAVTNTGFVPALSTCLLPFLPGDLVKTVLSAVLVNRLAPLLRRN